VTIHKRPLECTRTHMKPPATNSSSHGPNDIMASEPHQAPATVPVFAIQYRWTVITLGGEIAPSAVMNCSLSALVVRMPCPTSSAKSAMLCGTC
jgi:hypothetical protein